MLKKRIGIEAIEKYWSWSKRLSNYFKIPTTLIIPDGCEKIGNRVFECCEKLKEVVISRSVKSIGTCSFGGCNRLEEVIIPENVESIGDHAFEGCEKATIMIMNKSSESDFKFLGRHVFRHSTVSYVKEETRT